MHTSQVSRIHQITFVIVTTLLIIISDGAMLKKYIYQLATILTAAAKLKQVAEQAMRKFHDDDDGNDGDGDCYIH